MHDPFRNEKRTQLVREAQIGLSVVAIMLTLFAYVAFHRIMGHGYHLPEHVRNAPISSTIQPLSAPQIVNQGQLLTPNEFLEKQNAYKKSKFDPDTIKQRTHDLANEFTKELDSASQKTSKNGKGLAETLTSKFANDSKPDRIPKARPSVVDMLEAIKLPESSKRNGQSKLWENNRLAKSHAMAGESFRVQVTPADTSLLASGPKGEQKTASIQPDDPFVGSPQAVQGNPIYVNDLRNTENILKTKNKATLQANYDGSSNLPGSNFVSNDVDNDQDSNSFSRSGQTRVPVPSLAKTENATSIYDSNAPFQTPTILTNAEVDLPIVDKTSFEHSPVADQRSIEAESIIQAAVFEHATRNEKTNPIGDLRIQASSENDFNLPKSPIMTSSRPQNSSYSTVYQAGFVGGELQSDIGIRKPELQAKSRHVESHQPIVVSGMKAETPHTYISKSGDSFWSIAQDRYGDGRFFRALFKYNQPTVVDFDNLAAGTKIGTPAKADLFKLWPDLCPKPDSEQVVGTFGTKSDAASRLYVTQEGDTLFEIARQRLGQASRYLEIFNKNELRLDSSVTATTRLSPGLQLVLPVK